MMELFIYAIKRIKYEIKDNNFYSEESIVLAYPKYLYYNISDCEIACIYLTDYYNKYLKGNYICIPYATKVLSEYNPIWSEFFDNDEEYINKLGNTSKEIRTWSTQTLQMYSELDNLNDVIEKQYVQSIMSK